MNPQLHRELEGDSKLWLRVLVVGWVLGLGAIAAPVSWYAARRLIRRYRELGLAPSARANFAYWAGLGLTVAMVLVLLVAAATAVLANPGSNAVLVLRSIVFLARKACENPFFVGGYALVGLVFSVFVGARLREPLPSLT